MPLTLDQLQRAGMICAMERRHKTRLTAMFGQLLGHTRVACHGAPDRFVYMQPVLVDLLRASMRAFGAEAGR